MRLDGLASISADSEHGEWVTRPLTFTGNELEINFATSARGGIRIEIQDAQGKARFQDSLWMSASSRFGNEIERIVSWKQGSDLSSLRNQPVRLRFVMHDAVSSCFPLHEQEPLDPSLGRKRSGTRGHTMPLPISSSMKVPCIAHSARARVMSAAAMERFALLRNRKMAPGSPSHIFPNRASICEIPSCAGHRMVDSC